MRVKAGFARKWRNKRLAHADLATYREGQATALPEVARKDIEQVTEALCEPIRQVNEHFGQQSTLRTLQDPWGVKALLHHLKVAADHEN